MIETAGKKIAYILKLFLFTMMFAIIQEVLLSLNDESLLPNWLLGAMFTLLFATMYLVDIDVFFIKAKRFHKFMLSFWISWIIASQIDNLTKAFFYITGGML